MISKLLTTGLLIAAFSFATPALAGKVKVMDGASGSMLAAPCAGCHGPAGKSAGAAPDLAGLSASELAEALNDFKTAKQDKKNTIMARIAKGYSKADIAALSKEIASWK